MGAGVVLLTGMFAFWSLIVPGWSGEPCGSVLRPVADSPFERNEVRWLTLGEFGEANCPTTRSLQVTQFWIAFAAFAGAVSVFGWRWWMLDISVLDSPREPPSQPGRQLDGPLNTD